MSSRVDLAGSALTHKPMRHFSAKPAIRLPCLPIGLTPGTTISMLCGGFQPILWNPNFDVLVDPLHELRCLTIAFHFSGCKANLEMPKFTKLCRSNKRECQALLNTTGSCIFDVCLLAMMPFNDLILLSDNTDTLSTSTML